MSSPLQVGIIGLGPRYQKRYKTALLRRADRFAVRAVCDQVQQRALGEAKQLGCAAVAGPTEMFERADVEALLLLDLQWYRLWPLELVCRYKKPVYCCDMLARDNAYADLIYERLKECKLPVLMAMTPRFMPASSFLRELVDGQLGPPRMLLCDYTEPWRRRRPPHPAPPAGELDILGSALLDWCSSLMEGQPTSVQAVRAGSGEMHSLFLRFAEDRAIQFTCRRGPGLRRGMRLQVIGTDQSASVELPHRISWSDARGDHTLTLRPRLSVIDQLLDKFWQTVRCGTPPEPGIRESYRVLGWLRAGQRSAAERREIAL